MNFKGSPPPPQKIKNNIELEYSDYINNKIPILFSNNNLLFDYIIDYCKELRDNKTSNKNYDIRTILQKINRYLKELKENEIKRLNNLKEYYNENEDEDEVKIIKKNEKIINSHNLKAKGLIEIIIQITLNYYDLKVNTKTNITLVRNTKNKRFLQIMNIANGVSLQEFIISIYNNDNILNKNEYLLDALKLIAEKLDILQKECLFIHGDFHSNNIFIDINNPNNPVTIIDFGYSVIKIPGKNDLLLCGAEESNISRKNVPNLLKYPYLKATDLFHLIQNLVSYELLYKCKDPLKSGNETSVFKNFDLYINFIKQIQGLYFNSISKIYFKCKTNRSFTSSSDFDNSVFECLYPENFITLSLS